MGHVHFLCCAESLSCVWLFATLKTVAHQAPLSMGLSRQEYWSGLPCPPPGDPPKTGIEPRSPTLQADSLPSELPGKPTVCHRGYKTTRIPCAKVKLKKKIRWNNNEENFTESLSYVVAERSRCLGSHRCVTHGPTVRARSFLPKPFCLFFNKFFILYLFVSLTTNSLTFPQGSCWLNQKAS